MESPLTFRGVANVLARLICEEFLDEESAASPFGFGPFGGVGMPSPRSSLESLGDFMAVMLPFTCGTDKDMFAQDGEGGTGIEYECFGRGREEGYDDPFGGTRRDVDRNGMRLIVEMIADATEEPDGWE